MVEEISVSEAYERGYLDWVYYDKDEPVAVERTNEAGRYWLRYRGGVAASVSGNAMVTAKPRVAERVRRMAAAAGDPYYAHRAHGEGD